MIPEWELFLRLVLACVLGGVIGYERQSRRKSAGLRTNMLVCLRWRARPMQILPAWRPRWSAA